MELPKLRITEFELKEAEKHPMLRDWHSFNLSVKNCRITDVRMLYAIMKDQLKIETEIIERTEKEGLGDVHQLQYGVVEFLQKILNEMNKIEGIEDIGSYIIRTRC